MVVSLRHGLVCSACLLVFWWTLSVTCQPSRDHNCDSHHSQCTHIVCFDACQSSETGVVFICLFTLLSCTPPPTAPCYVALHERPFCLGNHYVSSRFALSLLLLINNSFSFISIQRCLWIASFVSVDASLLLRRLCDFFVAASIRLRVAVP